MCQCREVSEGHWAVLDGKTLRSFVAVGWGWGDDNVDPGFAAQRLPLSWSKSFEQDQLSCCIPSESPQGPWICSFPSRMGSRHCPKHPVVFFPFSFCQASGGAALWSCGSRRDIGAGQRLCLLHQTQPEQSEPWGAAPHCLMGGQG